MTIRERDFIKNRLWALRKAQYLNQDSVAAKSGVGVKTLSSFETGVRINSMKVSQLLCLLHVYGVTPAEFFAPLDVSVPMEKGLWERALKVFSKRRGRPSLPRTPSRFRNIDGDSRQ